MKTKNKNPIRRDVERYIQCYYDIVHLKDAIDRYGIRGSFGIQSSIACDKLVNLLILKDRKILEFKRLDLQLHIFGDKFFKEIIDIYGKHYTIKRFCDINETGAETFYKTLQKNIEKYGAYYGNSKV